MSIIAGRYALGAEKRRGGMADVYKAFDQTLSRQVAVKIFSQGRLDDDVIREAFQRELRALRTLSHPGIVKLHDYGVDEDDKPFLVLDWIESDISQLPRPAFKTFAGYYSDLGSSILEALAYAHVNGVVHRDIKPQNILRDASGPVIADFGVSKLKSWLEPSITLQHFRSVPFSAPEMNNGAYEYSRDVFSFAALTLQCLSKKTLLEYADLYAELDEIQWSDDVHSIFRRALSEDPTQRQQNAQLLLGEIRRAGMGTTPSKTLRLHVTITKKATDTFLQMSTKTRDAIERRVIAEFSGQTAFESRGSTDPEGTHLAAYGATLSCHLALQDDGCSFALINVREMSSNRLEQRREESCIIPTDISFVPPADSRRAKLDVSELLDEVAAYESARSTEEAQASEEGIINDWSRLLSLREEIDRERQAPLRYSSYVQDGNRFRFAIEEPIAPDMVGQERVVELDGRTGILGEVEDVVERDLTLYVSGNKSRSLPQKGTLLLDYRASRQAIKRQRQALDALRNGRSVQKNLKALLLDPDGSKPPISTQPPEFINEGLDEAKKGAVEKVIGIADFLVVEGPPGTGKTTFITEAVLQILRVNASARILIASQTHVALDNVLENLQGSLNGERVIRIARDDDKVAKNVRGFLLRTQAEAWSRGAIATGKNFLEQWATSSGISPKQFAISTLLRELASVAKRLAVVKDDIQELRSLLAVAAVHADATLESEEPDADELGVRISDLEREFAALVRSREAATKSLCEMEPDASDLVSLPVENLEEWAETYLPTTAAADKYRKLVDLQAEWHLRLSRSTDFESAVVAASQVVAGTCIGLAAAKGISDVGFDYCIIDEASKATATELLVPMVRAERIVLVGDTRQLPPFIEDDFRARLRLPGNERLHEIGTQSLFARLTAGLPAHSKAMLSEQHRMVPPIGDLVSKCFYTGTLTSRSQPWNALLKPILPRPVVWLTTTRREDRREGLSGHVNNCEVGIVTKLLAQADEVLARRARAPLKVLVITGYREQVAAFNRAFAPMAPRLKWVDVECNTVDAVQGRQADMVIYSVVRSNAEGRIGFLRSSPRLNVALSRGKQQLVIVGDFAFCKSAEGENPFYDVALYIENHRDECSIEEA